MSAERGTMSCPVIVEFIGQGAPKSGPTPPAATETAGCAVITEFIGQGAPTAPLLAALGFSAGCTSLTEFVGQGAATSDRPGEQASSPK
jgi:hypothetical protein